MGMLVLSRHVNEEILIGDDIRIMVVEIGQSRVRLGITAPKGLAVDRLEVRKSKEADRADRADRAEE